MTLLTGSSAAIKYVLFAFNLVFVITGIILISVGAAVQGVYGNFSHFLDANFFSIPAFLIAIGVIIFFIAFFGCCGAVKEHYCMVLTFSILMIVVFILELSAGIAGYALRGQTEEMLNRNLNSTMKYYGMGNDSDPAITVLWDFVQADFSCCGIHNYTDWSALDKPVPRACCPVVPGTPNKEACAGETGFFQVGCVDALGDFITAHAVSLGGAGIGIAVVQFLGIFFACYVAKQIKARQYGTP